MMELNQIEYEVVPNVIRESSDLPPDYHKLNIIEKIVYVRSISTSSRQFVQNVYGVTCSSFLSFMIVFILLGPLAIAQAYIGLANLNKCPTEPIIPIWLFVSAILNGLLIALKFIHNVTVISNQRREERLVRNSSIFYFASWITVTLVLAWFTFGNIWVYNCYKRIDYNPEKAPYQYCDKVLYLFSFWYLNSVFITLALLAFVIPCVLCLVKLFIIK